MLEQSVRPLYQKCLVDPLARRITHKIGPLPVTLLSGACGLLFIPAIILNYPLIAIGFLLISGYCDTLDGTLARLQNSTSSLGTVFDIMMDRLVEFSVILGLYLVAPEERSLAIILMLGSILLCITSFLVVGIFTPNDSQKSFHYSPGLMERAEAFIFFILMTILPQYFILLAFLFTFLVSLTAVIRLKQFMKAQTADSKITLF
ncbi:cytochrome oxidase-like protein [Legionella lansingensis]|uniref:Cytochrome oxidase-like protein n=1 Tax=Legionella lansingensis TaxID=45067 RepID=A0A0W0VLK9_9GAMM|nr:CDP-alcohol phosphatidyltransferase family protein [Legionella lansingensis]KTD20952.1 cytochrome oxidase-like protein [Legionella lansingensis]SNV44503.1 cytochrome oxidase-like protein [Legionella lansingensis]